MSKEINRREFLELAGLGVAGALLSACGASKEEFEKLQETIRQSTPTAMAEQPTAAIEQPTAVPATIEQPTAVPTATAVPEVSKAVVGEIILTNIPEEVDENVVDIAKGEFENRTGVAPHVFADPGGLLVRPDFGYTGGRNPWGNNPGGWEKMYESEGSIQPISPVSQEVIRWAGEAYQNLPEGGFVFFSGGKMTVKLGETIIEMPDKGPGHNYFFVARGLYADGKQDIDRNTNVCVTDYVPGHTELSMYQSKDKTNLGFISEGQFLQKVATSHSSGTNCGAEGCSELTLVAFDTNTSALEIHYHRQGETDNLEEAIKAAGENWQLVHSNYREAK